MDTKPKRRSRDDCRPMPKHVSLADVDEVCIWPLGKIMTVCKPGNNWTDVVLFMDEEIRVGGRYNTRRVRYDGQFYITHNARRVQLVGDLVLEVFEKCNHVYGYDLKADAEYNKMLKGY